MNRRLALIIGTAALAAVLAAACGGGGGGGGNGTPTASTPTASTSPATVASPTFTSDGGASTPTSFEGQRDALAAQLDAIGANIGAVPDDVHDQILSSCRALGDFADRGKVDDICQAIDRAIKTGDPGLIDLVLNELAQLKPK